MAGVARLLVVGIMMVVACTALMGGKGRRGGGMATQGSFTLSSGSNRAGNSEDSLFLGEGGEDAAGSLDNAPNLPAESSISSACGQKGGVAYKGCKAAFLAGFQHAKNDKPTPTPASDATGSHTLISRVRKAINYGNHNACVGRKSIGGLTEADQKALYKANPSCSWGRLAIAVLKNKKAVAANAELILNSGQLFFSFLFPLDEKLPSFKCIEISNNEGPWGGSSERKNKLVTWACCTKDGKKPIKKCRHIWKEGKARKIWYGGWRMSEFCVQGANQRMCAPPKPMKGNVGKRRLGEFSAALTHASWGSRRRRSKKKAGWLARRRRTPLKKKGGFFGSLLKKGSSLMKKVSKGGGNMLKKLAKGGLGLLKKASGPLIKIVMKFLKDKGFTWAIPPLKLLLEGKIKKATIKLFKLVTGSLAVRRFVRHQFVQRWISGGFRIPYITMQSAAVQMSAVYAHYVTHKVAVIARKSPKVKASQLKCAYYNHTAGEVQRNTKPGWKQYGYQRYRLRQEREYGDGPLHATVSQIYSKNYGGKKKGWIQCQMEMTFDFLFCDQCGPGKVLWSPTSTRLSIDRSEGCEKWFIVIDKATRTMLGSIQALFTVDQMSKGVCIKRKRLKAKLQAAAERATKKASARDAAAGKTSQKMKTATAAKLKKVKSKVSKGKRKGK